MAGGVVGMVEPVDVGPDAVVAVVLGADCGPPLERPFEEEQPARAKTRAAAGTNTDERVGTGLQATLSAVFGAVMPAGHPAAYDVLVGLHVVSAVIGFGAVAISGAYGAIGRNVGRPGTRAEAGEEVRRYFASGSALEYLVLVAPVFGVAAMSVRPGGSEFGQIWAVAGTIIWVAAGGLLTAVIRPAARRIRQAGSDMTDVAPEARRLMWAAAVSDVLFVVALFLMVTQPR